MIVACKTDPAAGGKGVSLIPVEKTRPGRSRIPILHGLTSYGIADHSILRMFRGNDSACPQRPDMRFCPGEAQRAEAWDNALGIASFRVRAIEREPLVTNNGRADFVT
ncbi:MAG: hypothetical protein EPO10_16755 [Reyranella sp.]|nr:MAG: hypothetical protein EPO10_16755 [Reyranella sp.]